MKLQGFIAGTPIGIAAVVVVLGFLLWLETPASAWKPAADSERYRTELVTRGDILETVSVSGTLNPVNVVLVGTQVSGTISRIYVGYNDIVQAGQLLAELDPSVYRAAVSQSQANLSSARAAVVFTRQAEARRKDLLDHKLIARQDLDEATQARITAEAQLAVTQAQLVRDRSNLGYTKIYAPISGVVLSREVAVGQTVAAAFQTPTLFKIAEDLKKMEIQCNVPEADVGVMRPGQHATFSVDAFPDRKFKGRLVQIRLDPKITQGVVAYSVIVAVDNDRGDLMPGMTALVNVALAERRDVIRVPSAALSYAQRRDQDPTGSAKVYVIEGDRLWPKRLEPGHSDGTHTEVRGEDLLVGTPVVVGEVSGEATSATAN